VSDPKNTPVAFIGLGNMGGPMAINLAKAGYPVAAFDLSAEACKKVAEGGASIAASAADAVKGAKVVVSMLPASRHVEGLYLGDNGLLAKLSPGTLVIDSSTIAPASARKVAEAAAAKGVLFLDGPVSGGTAGATAGTLTFMVGGDTATLEAATPLIKSMGANIFHAGGVGAGQGAKLCNNMLLAILMIGTSEALSLGMSLGLDPKVLSEVMRRSSGGNWTLEKYNPVPGVAEGVPASRGYTGGFGTDLMLKDVGLALEAALGTGACVPLGGMARELYAAHSKAGNGGLDFSSIINMLNAKA
jgi:3-hydroxyisobutyrate dehydrogenase